MVLVVAVVVVEDIRVGVGEDEGGEVEAGDEDEGVVTDVGLDLFWF